jgi:hypothetical protein
VAQAEPAELITRMPYHSGGYTLRIAPRTWYAGSPEPDRHKANDAGSVHLVELDGPGAPERVETVAVRHFCWVRLEVELLDGTCDGALRALEALSHEHRCCVVSLRLAGSVGLAERRRLDGELKRWEARLHHLEVDDAGLVDEPTAEDLDALGAAGFMRAAVDRLRAKASDAADPERDAACVALRMLYLDHLGAARPRQGG